MRTINSCTILVSYVNYLLLEAITILLYFTIEPNQDVVGSSSFVFVGCDFNQIKTFNFLNLIAVLNTAKVL